MRLCTGGSDGDSSVRCILPAGALVIAPRQRKLSTEQEAVIPTLAGTKSLRALAAEFGVSHETIRTVLKAHVKGTARRHVPTHDDSANESSNQARNEIV